MELDRRGGPLLGFGCVSLGSVTQGRSWQSDFRLVQSAVDSGITVFDTADAYGNGASEAILGRALRGRRDHVTIATKVGYQFSERSLREHSIRRVVAPLLQGLRSPRPDGRRGRTSAAYAAQDFTSAGIRGAVDASLRRLQTDSIDVVHLHAPRSVLPDALRTVRSLIDAGKVRRFGVGAERVDAAVSWLTCDGVDVVEVPFGVLDPEVATNVIPLAATHDVDVWARGVLGGGYIGLAELEVAKPGSTQLRDDPKWPLLETLTTVAREAGVPLAQLALDYVRSFGGIAVILVGLHSPQHLADAVAMTSQAPDPDLVDAVQSVLSEWTGANEPT